MSCLPIIGPSLSGTHSGNLQQTQSTKHNQNAPIEKKPWTLRQMVTDREKAEEKAKEEEMGKELTASWVDFYRGGALNVPGLGIDTANEDRRKFGGGSIGNGHLQEQSAPIASHSQGVVNHRSSSSSTASPASHPDLDAEPDVSMSNMNIMSEEPQAQLDNDLLDSPRHNPPSDAPPSFHPSHSR